MLPQTSILPEVGSLIREMSLRRVLLPAPFGPISATHSPRFISTDKSFSAHMCALPLIILSSWSGCPMQSRNDERDFFRSVDESSKNFLLNCDVLIASAFVI